MCEAIKKIDELLKRWGDWQRTGNGFGASVCMRYAPKGGEGVGLMVVRNPACEALDRIVCEMGEVFGGHYRRMVVSIYVHNATLHQVAQDQRCSRETIKDRLNGARAWLHAMATAHKLFD